MPYILSYGSTSGNVAVIVPVWASIVSTMSLNVTGPTSVSVILSDGQLKLKSSIVTGSVVTVNSALPCLVGSNGACAVSVALASSRPCGSFDPLGVIHPTVAVTVADSVAVPAPVPAPATSPEAVKKAPSVLSAVTVGVPTKCSPPLRVVSVGVTTSCANAPVGSIAGPINTKATAIAAVGIPIFLMLSDIFPRLTEDS